MPANEEDRRALALAALAEITDPDQVGDLLAVEQPEPGVVDLRFACTLAAYAGWSWVVSTSDVEGVDPTVLEVELLPGEGALLAPPWVPWAERLAEWRRQHPDERHPGEDDAEIDEDREDEDAELDEDDLADDDGLDELDEAELEGEVSPEEVEQDSGDVSDEDDAEDSDGAADDDADDSDEDDSADEDDDADDDDFDADEDDERGPRPADEDRSL